MKNIKLFLACATVWLVWAPGPPARAQGPAGRPTLPEFTIDVKTFKSEGSIPFDRPFLLKLTSVDVTATQVQLSIFTGLDPTAGTQVGSTQTLQINNPNSIPTIPVPANLLANRQYHFRITMVTPATSRGITYGFETRTKLADYIKMDLGLAYVPAIKGVISQTAVHFYLLPVNSDADMRSIRGLGRNIFTRTSFFIGISPVLLYSDTKQPIVSSTGIGNLVYGIGIRSPFYGRHLPFNRNFGWVFLQPLRLNIGQLYFKQDEANVLISKNKNKLCPYIGLSYDISIAGVLGPIAKLINP